MHKVSKKVGIKHFLDLLVLADLHGAATVRSLALKFIVDNGREIVAQTGWRDKLKVQSLFDKISSITCPLGVS